MSDSNKLPLTLCAIAVLVTLAGVFAPLGPAAAMDAASGAAAPNAAAAANAGTSCAHDETPFEQLLFGTSQDDERLLQDAAPLLVYRVPAGLVLRLTDVDATAGGLVLWRRAQQQLVQVGFVVDRGSVGSGQSSRSYATGIPFGPGDELLVGAAGGAVEWAALRGVVKPAGVSAPSP